MAGLYEIVEEERVLLRDFGANNGRKDIMLKASPFELCMYKTYPIAGMKAGYFNNKGRIKHLRVNQLGRKGGESVIHVMNGTDYPSWHTAFLFEDGKSFEDIGIDSNLFAGTGATVGYHYPLPSNVRELILNGDLEKDSQKIQYLVNTGHHIAFQLSSQVKSGEVLQPRIRYPGHHTLDEMTPEESEVLYKAGKLFANIFTSEHCLNLSYTRIYGTENELEEKS
jgi:hypothetical protein